MAWVMVAGAVISAAGAVYSAKSIEAGNEVKKRQVDLQSKQGEIDALSALNDRKEQLSYVNASIVNQTMAAGTDAGSSGSVSSILNKNNSNMKREESLAELNITGIRAQGAMEKSMLDFNSKTTMTAAYVQGAGTIMSAWGTKSMLGDAKTGL